MANKDQSTNFQQFKGYSPSWVDHLTGWVDRLPGPNWTYYTALMLLLFLIQLGVLYTDGILTDRFIDPAHIFIAAAIPYMLFLIHYFDHRAIDALQNLNPSLTIDDQEYEQLETLLTSLPALPTILAGLLGLGCVFLLEAISGAPYQLVGLNNYPISGTVFRIAYMLLWGVFGTFIYHTIHQLRLIGWIYTQFTCINLFKPKSLYAFSNLIALTAFCTALLPIGFLIANPWAAWNDPVVFGAVLAVQIIALGSFIWPHLGIHRLQVAEKEHLIEEANIRFEAISLKLHQKVDDDNLDGAMDVSMTVSGLNTELSTLEKIPTWPWQPETLRFLITALAFPLGIWVIQMLLGRLIGN